jgi:tetratricopeptide (TPR) repeat protein
MAQQAWYKRQWKRVITALIAILLLIVGAVVWILNTEHLIQGDWSTILPIVFTVLALIVALLTWLFPFSPDQPEASALPLVRELVHQRAIFRMGDTTAANFDYITEPIKQAYDSARQALRDASVGVGSKRGILILGTANAGKTRLAFEALTQTLPDWNVLFWNATYDTKSKVLVPTVSRRSGLVVFIDDLQEYVSGDGSDAYGSGFLSDTRSATLVAFLQSMQTAKHLVVVATCRLEDEMRVGARLRWLFDQLKVITLQRFRVEVTDPESATIIDLFQQHGAINVGDWDGTLGSLVLGLYKKQSQYEQLVQSHHPAVAVLRAMKLLSLAFITVHTYSRIQGVCTGVLKESTLKDGTKTWQESVDLLTLLEFVTEEKDKVSGTYALVIRKDTYFDKVITDYPAKNRPYQLEQHFGQLQKVLTVLSDSLALVSLGIALFDLKRYEEALVAYDQVIRLDPKDAFAYNGKEKLLRILEREGEVRIVKDEETW